MKRKLIAGLAGIFMMVGLMMTAQAENKGAAEIVLNGGKTGNVPFPHHRHQSVLADCNACHDLFPQQQGVIHALKSENKMKSKTVMNNCQKCHRQTAKEGKKSGPVSCKQCHAIKA